MVARERSPLQRRARELLEARGEPVDALEIASRVLGLSSGPPELRRRLVEEFLSAGAGFVRESSGAWRYGGVSATEGDLEAFPFLVLEGVFWTTPGGERHLVELAGRSLGGGDADDEPPHADFRLAVRPPDAVLRAAAAGGAHHPDVEELRGAPALPGHLSEIWRRLHGRVLVAYRPSPLAATLQAALRATHGLEEETDTLSLRGLARRVHPERAHATLHDLAGALALPHAVSERASDRAALAADVLLTLLAELRERGVRSWNELEAFVLADAPGVDLSGRAFDSEWLRALPETPGVYRIYERVGDLLYVGKSRNLRSRVSSYFRGSLRRDERAERIARHAHRIEIEETGSELLALLAEEREIREARPLLNVQREVQPRGRLESAGENLALLLPGARAEEAVVLFYRPPSPLEAVPVNREGPLAEGGRRALEEALHRALAPAPTTGESPAPPPDDRAQLEVAASWLALHRHRVTRVNLAGVRDARHALALLDAARRGDAEGAETAEGGVEYR